MSRQTTKIRYGIIGSGMMGLEHVRNIQLLPDAEITAVTDHSAEIRESTRIMVGEGCKSYTNHRDLIACGQVDALVIATPNHTHFDLLFEIMDSGIPILVEKPLATNISDCNEILQNISNKSSKVWVGMEYRYMPPVHRLRQEIEADTVGNLKMFSIREHRYPLLNKGWNLTNSNTGGTMVEKCCHHLDLMCLVASAEPTQIYASGGRDVNHLTDTDKHNSSELIDNAYVIVNFDNGIRASLDLCLFSEGAYWQEILSATGDRGRIEAFIPGPTRFNQNQEPRQGKIAIADRFSKTERCKTIPVDISLLAAGDHHGATYYQHRKFVDMIRNDGTPDVSVQDGMRSVMMGLAAEESMRTGKVVEF